MENNLAEQNIESTPKPKRGRKAKSEEQPQLSLVTEQDSEIADLKAQLEDLRKTNERLQKYVNLISVTASKKLFESTDEDVNMLYIKYLTENQMTLNNARIIKVDNKTLLLKSYYEI